MNDFFDNQRILQVIWKRKFHFIVIGIAAVILAAIFSGPAFIKPKFKSTARVYPTNNIAVLSEESETEQLLELLGSRDIKLKMFDVFNLGEVYNISKDDPYYLTYMLDIYNTNVNISKTKFETVEIEVLDYDPARAAAMCDSLIRFYNDKVGDMYSLKHIEVVEITEKYINNKSKELDSISNMLQQLRNETGIISTSQLERITEGYMSALAANKGESSGAREIKQKMDYLKDYSDDIFVLEMKFNKYNQLIDSLRTVKEVQVLEAEKDITYAHIVEYPVPADKKSYPVRWLIAAFSTVSAVFLALLVFLVLDYRKEE
ncbi:MAG TPA: Wzz/FepE/Etk N-terminal domain-containing protein [Tangfeifania sp.]|nr:Wzz/FepE/Etk N-terminal domain-containing protein [Tangfeifania sp.]